MRVHMNLDDDLVAEPDRRVGGGRRSGFVAEAILRATTSAVARVASQRVESTDPAVGSRAAQSRGPAPELPASGDTPFVSAVKVEEVLRGLPAGEETGTQRLLPSTRHSPARRP